MAEILIYSKPDCPYCDMAKRLLVAKGQTWTEIDIEAEAGKRDEMVERSGRRTVPQIWIGERHVGGFDALAALDGEGELDSLLGVSHQEVGVEHSKIVIVGSGPAGYTAAV